MRAEDERPSIKNFHLALDKLYNTGCGCPTCASNAKLTDESKAPKFNKKHFDAAVKHLHGKGKLTPGMINDKPVKALTKETARILNDAIDFAIADNVAPTAMLQALKNDVYLFSGMKTYSQLKTASALLLTDDGKRKPFNDFAKDVEVIHKNYNRTYLEAEYYFATGSAQMAAHWANLDSTGRYNLQYRTAGDSKVRDSHNALRDTTLPSDDNFWSEYYPPNGWRCRCFVLEVLKSRYATSDSEAAIKAGNTATTAIGKDGKNSLAIFRFNPGKQKIIFPPAHPYKGDLSKCSTGTLADGSGQDERCKVAAELQKQIKEDLKIERAKADTEIKDWAQDKIKRGASLIIENEELQTGTAKLSRANIEALLKHIGNVENKQVIKSIEKIIADCKYENSAELDKTKSSKNYGDKIGRGVVRYHYYKSVWEDRAITINMEEMKDGYEQPYSITFDK